MKSVLWLVLLIFAAELMLISAMVPNDWLNDALQEEVESVRDSMGNEEAVSVKNKADSWFNSLMIKSGFISTVNTFLLPQEDSVDTIDADEGANKAWFGFIEKRIEAIQRVVYHVMIRFSLLLTWLPFLVLTIVPSLYDGYNLRKAKQVTFDYTSPVVHRYSLYAAFGVTIMLLFIFLLPVAFNPIIIPAAVILTAMLLGMVAGNVQKRF